MKDHLARVDTGFKFELRSQNTPAGDQPKAIEALVKNIQEGERSQVLLGATGTGKTFTVANVIQELNRPALVLAHNKTLAAQLYSEFKELFPNNAVRYFVSYYDYFQPEAYVPSTNTYIEKDSAINDEIDKLRHAATKALLERKDVIIVSSVSCIYGLGDPQMYFNSVLFYEKGDKIAKTEVLKKLVGLQFSRDDQDFKAGTFRVRGDVLEICPPGDDELSVRIEFFGDEIEQISEIERLTGKQVRKLSTVCIYPASHFVTAKPNRDRAVITIRQELEHRLKELERAGKTLEAQRLEQRTLYDLELLEEMGFCPGIENYSRHMTGRKVDEPPPTLVDYFPDDFLLFVDESHVTLPQVVGMSRGDRARKTTLVEYGFRLPSALDNRPLRYEEFSQKTGQTVYVSATPAKFEMNEANGKIVQQIIRPTGLLDPPIEIRPALSQVDDFLEEIRKVVERNERVLVTTLTKKMAEHLTKYYQELGVKIRYLHSDIHTLDRIELIRGLRDGTFDVLVGINLLREGLDLPEVSLVGIMDGDKEGFLRSETALIQTIGRAARNINSKVIIYADKMTDSIKYAVAETDRRRAIQSKHNEENGITPRSVSRAPEAMMVDAETLEETLETMPELLKKGIPREPAEVKKLINDMKFKMVGHAKALEFEQAAEIRDKIGVLERYLLSI
jgi:excinuclease ABC subunit B